MENKNRFFVCVPKDIENLRFHLRGSLIYGALMSHDNFTIKLVLYEHGYSEISDIAKLF